MVLESIIFWLLVGLIAWKGAGAPSWAFAFLFYYVIYLVIRFVFAKTAADRMIYLNIVNIIVLLGLFAWFTQHR